MHPRSLRPSVDICLRCQWCLVSRSQKTARLHTSHNPSTNIRLSKRRAFHTSAPVCPRHQPHTYETNSHSAHSLLLPQRPSTSPLTLSSSLGHHNYQFAITWRSGRIYMDSPVRRRCLLSRGIPWPGRYSITCQESRIRWEQTIRPRATGGSLAKTTMERT